MNPLRRFWEPSQSSDQPLPDDSALISLPRKIPKPKPSSVKSSENLDPSDPVVRQEPIPPPSHPKQYRAIGLIYGHYQASEDHLTRGTLATVDGQIIDAVILGRVISLIKKHLDLDTPHLWVVYPRTRQDEEHLHVQIVGVWEPETLSQETSPLQPHSPDDPKVQHGYFSIRGEVVFFSPERKDIIVKIRQSNAKEPRKAKFFKINLQGTLSERPVNHFWDLKVCLQGNTLVVQEATDLGLMAPRKPSYPRKSVHPNKIGRYSRDERPMLKKTTEEQKESQNRPILPKPSQLIKKKPL